MYRKLKFAHPKYISLFFLMIFLVGSGYWYRKTKLPFPKEMPSNKEVSIFYSSQSVNSDQLKQLNQYDAIAVPDLFLIKKLQKKGIHVPLFFVPEEFNLDVFFSQSLKTKPNSTFNFGHIATSLHFPTYEGLIKAFIQAFGGRTDIVLQIQFPTEKFSDIRKKLSKVFEQLNTKNVFLSDIDMTKDGRLQFFQSIDCLINLSPNQKLFGLESLAMGIPVITGAQDPILSKSEFVATFDF